MLNFFVAPPLRKITYLLILSFLLAALTWFVLTVEFLSWDFRNELWAPSHLLWQRESAYNTTILFPDSLAVWFPQIIGVFFPLGLLSQYQATNVWLLINVSLLVYLTWFLAMQAGRERPGLFLFSILLTSVFLFPPTFRLLRLGQVDIIFLAATIVGVHVLKQQRLAMSAFCCAIALAKPQLSMVVLPCLIGYLLFIKKDWRSTIKFTLSIPFFVLILTTPLWISNRKWIVDFLSNLSANPVWLQPSTFSQLYPRMGMAGALMWFVFYLLTLIVSLYLWQRFGPSYAVLWSIALTTIVCPYIWSWDFTLLLPLLMDTAVRLTTKIARIVLFVFYILSLILSIISLQSTYNASDDVLWWFPIVVITGIILSLILSRSTLTAE